MRKRLVLKKKKKDVYVGRLLHPQGTRNLGRIQISTNRWEGQAGFWVGQKKRKEHPPALTM